MNFYCKFCDQRCKRYDPDSPWWHCSSCKVHFDDVGAATIFHLFQEDGSFYSLNFYYNRNTTELWFEQPFKSDGSPKITQILSINHIMEGVTPSNLEQKIRTLITFS